MGGIEKIFWLARLRTTTHIILNVPGKLFPITVDLFFGLYESFNSLS